MPDMRFSCPQCSQHISCDEAWAGHQIQCPACHRTIDVPSIQTVPAFSPASIRVKESPKAVGAKLAAGATSVARSTAHAPTPTRKFIPRHPRSDNSLLKVGGLLVLVAVLAGAGYFYGLPLLTNAVQKEPNANPSAGAKSSQSGGTMGGPMGEVNGAMDVSEALDGGSSSTRTPPKAATNTVARPRSAKPPQ